MQHDLLLTARWVLPVTAAPVERGAVLVRDGRIAACGREADVASRASTPVRLELGEAAILPGLVNVHTHLELTGLRGFLEEVDFFAWIRKLTETKYERLTPGDLLLSARWGVVELLRAGVTTVGEVCDLGVSLAPLVEGGLRGVLYQEVFGPDAADADRRFAELKEKMEAHRRASGGRVRVGASPHAPYTVSRDLFRRVAQLASEEDVPLCVHAAESRAERELLSSGTGPFADHLRQRGIPWEPPGCSTVRYLEELGVLEAGPLLVHCVDSTPADLERVAATGGAVAHCPKSNAKLGHGVAPLVSMLAAKVPVGIGSDGVVSNNAVDLFEELRTALLLQRVGPLATEAGGGGLQPAEALRLLTIEGARVLGLADETGSIEVGKSADLAAVDLSLPHMQPLHNVETAVVWGASARDVVLTMIAGEVVYNGERVQRVDEGALRKELAALPRKLRRTLKKSP